MLGILSCVKNEDNPEISEIVWFRIRYLLDWHAIFRCIDGAVFCGLMAQKILKRRNLDVSSVRGDIGVLAAEVSAILIFYFDCW